MDNKKKREELVELFNKNQQLIQQQQNEVARLSVLQERIKGKLELIEEIEKDNNKLSKENILK